LSIWNHFNTTGDRTNNRVEGDNNRMKNFFNSSKPNILTAVIELRHFEAFLLQNMKMQKKRPLIRRLKLKQTLREKLSLITVKKFSWLRILLSCNIGKKLSTYTLLILRKIM
jgi:hypothetical protein